VVPRSERNIVNIIDSKKRILKKRLKANKNEKKTRNGDI